MAYARYSRDCEWYIFWVTEVAKRREDERLAVWHVGLSTGHEFSYPAVRDMIGRSDFSPIPGRKAHDDALLRLALSQFLADVDREWRNRGAAGPDQKGMSP